MKLSLKMILILLLAIQCQSKVPIISTGLYYWKTNFQLSASERQWMNELATQRLYVKFFDVDGNKPMAEINWQPSDDEPIEIIPTIFITNRTFTNIRNEDLIRLADNIVKKLIQLAKGYPFQEIQLDCDWSNSTQLAYFQLIDYIKAQLPDVAISATIRLHQVKYFERTGVPPVASGMLMCYNMGNLEEWATENSILDITSLQPYLVNFDRYPLALNVVLPLFSWAVIYRDGQLTKLISQFNINSLTDQYLFRQLSSSRWEVLQNTYLAGHYLYAGDRIRVEQVTIDQLSETVTLLRKVWKEEQFTLAFYHLDTTIVQQFPAEKLLEIMEEWR
jgi:hypothetical protein